jgi:hypothetical protein
MTILLNFIMKLSRNHSIIMTVNISLTIVSVPVVYFLNCINIKYYFQFEQIQRTNLLSHEDRKKSVDNCIKPAVLRKDNAKFI